MKKLLTILFLIIAITSKSQVSVTAGGGIAPTGSYAGYYGTYIQGATKVVYDTVARNAIPSYYRDTLTFMVYTKSDSSYWILSGGTANSNYKKVSQFSSVAPTATIKGSGVIGNVAYFNGTTQLGSTNNLSIDTPSGILYAYKQQTTNSNYKPLNTDPSSPSVGVSVYSKTVNGVTEPYYIDSLGRSSRLSTTGVSVVNNTGSIIPQFYPICTDSSSSLAVAKGNYQKFFPYAVTQDAIPIGGYGRVVYNGGIVTGLNLSTYQNGASVYLADGGGLSKTPSTVYPAIRIGVVSSNLVNGSLLVSIGSASSDTSSLPNLLTSNNYWTGNNTYRSVLLRNFYDTSAKATLGYINNSPTISDNVGIYLPSVRSTGFVDVDTIAYRSWVRDSVLGLGYVPYTNATTDLDLNAKSFKNFFISKTADATAKFAFDVSGLSTATTRTVTVPDRSLTLDNITTSSTTNITGLLKGNGSVVGAAVSGTDIKTINGSSILGSGDLTVSGSGITGTIAAGLIPYGASSSTVNTKSTFIYDSTNNGGVKIGTGTLTSTANPAYLNLGGTYSSTNGSNMKLILNSATSTVSGLGYSTAGIDYVSANGHTFYATSGGTTSSSATINYSSGSANMALLGSNATYLANGLSGTEGGSIKYQLFSSAFGFGLTTQGIDYVTGGSSYSHKFWVNGTKYFQFNSDGALIIQSGGTFTSTSASDKIQANGNLNLTAASSKIKINAATASTASIGTATLVAGTVTVSTTAVTSSSKIFVTYNTPSGTLSSGLSSPTGSIVNGTSFVINSLTTAGVVNTLDTSTVNWWIIN